MSKMNRLNFFITILMASLLGPSVSGSEYENPYVNKHIDSHAVEFYTWEVINDFTKTIELYNADSRNKIKIIIQRQIVFVFL